MKEEKEIKKKKERKKEKKKITKIWRGRQEVGRQKGVAENFDDGGQKQRQRVKRDSHANVYDHMQINFPILEHVKELLPRKLRLPRHACIVQETALEQVTLFFGEPEGCLREVWEVKVGNNGKK